MTLPATPRFDVVVVGGGIVGLATAHAVARTGRSVAVVEREPQLARHQTGNNSNVIHSGLYYAPGGLKARLAVAGCAETVAFCRRFDLPHAVTGKLVVATEPEELPRLAELARRGAANGVEAHELDQAGMREHEPHVRGIAALHVPSTGITDYRLIAEKLAELVAKEGGEIHVGRPVTKLRRRASDVVVRTEAGDLLAKQVVVLRRPALRRGGARRRRRSGHPHHPVPRRVLRLQRARRRAREGARSTRCPTRRSRSWACTPPAVSTGTSTPARTPCSRSRGRATRGATVKPKEFLQTIAYPGMLRVARKHWRYGFGEMHRSLSRAAMVKEIQRMLPDVRAEDLHRAGAGVRAQAVKPDGTLVDDFLFVEQGGANGIGGEGSILHVLNAPSPAATAAMPIGREILERLTGERLAPLSA